jgi:hypothetical protein
MKSVIIAAMLSVFAYASVGAIMKSVETQKSHKEQIKTALALR